MCGKSLTHAFACVGCCYTSTMSFLQIFHGTTTQSVILIDIGSASISGAYIQINKKYQPILYYTASVPIRARNNSSQQTAIELTLTELVKMLVMYGAPVFARSTGTSAVDRVLVSIAGPWQHTHTRTERISRPKAFKFTRHIMDEMVEKASVVPPGTTQTNKMVITTILNGYEVNNPFGKSAHDAAVIVLSSFVTSTIADATTKILRKAFNTDEIEITAFAPIAYTVFRTIYPHENDFLIMDVTGEATDLALVKQGLLVEVANLPLGINIIRQAAIKAGFNSVSSAQSLKTIEEVVLIDTEHNEEFTKHLHAACTQWLDKLSDALQKLTVQYALPHTIFLISDEESLGFLKHTLENGTSVQKLWLSNEGPPIIAINAGKFAQYVVYRGTASGNTFLSLLALYAVYENSTTNVHI